MATTIQSWSLADLVAGADAVRDAADLPILLRRAGDLARALDQPALRALFHVLADEEEMADRADRAEMVNVLADEFDALGAVAVGSLCRAVQTALKHESPPKDVEIVHNPCGVCGKAGVVYYGVATCEAHRMERHLVHVGEALVEQVTFFGGPTGYRAWEPGALDTGNVTFVNGVSYVEIGSRDFPKALCAARDKREPGHGARIRAHRDAELARSVALIVAAFPEAKAGKASWRGLWHVVLERHA